jgi:hypothetical protein
MFTADWWLDKLYLAPGILFGLVVHEFCHGYAAWRMGDPTAKLAGRLSFNPLKHLDLLGTVALFVARIGWAKPVPVDARNFRDPRKGILITSLAGPASNLALGAVLGVALGGLFAYALKTPAAFDSSWLRLLYLSYWLYSTSCRFRRSTVRTYCGRYCPAAPRRLTAGSSGDTVERSSSSSSWRFSWDPPSGSPCSNGCLCPLLKSWFV